MSNGMNDPFLDNLLKDIQKDKKFVDDLMRRVAQIRWELKGKYFLASCFWIMSGHFLIRIHFRVSLMNR